MTVKISTPEPMKWEIFYSDGSSISSEDCSPFSIPTEKHHGVQVIFQQNKEAGFVSRCDHDFYVWDDRGGGGQWFNATYSGMIQYLMHPGHKCVLMGYEIDKRTYQMLFNDARKKFGEKLSFERDERQP